MSPKQLPSSLPPSIASDRKVVARAEQQAHAAPAAAAPQALPAVNLKVSDVAAGTLAAAAAAAEPATALGDRELLDALKKRIQSGDFKIDYSGLARSMVEDAVLAIAPRRGPM